VDESETIRTQMGNTINQTWSQCMERLVQYHLVTIASVLSVLFHCLHSSLSGIKVVVIYD
jgi:hypothetical protein